MTGTDTGVGKTLVSCALLHKWSSLGLRTLGIKPVAAGTTRTPEGAGNEDVLMLQRYSSVCLPYEHVNPVLLNEPIAPHIAAQRIGLDLVAEDIFDACDHALNAPADCLLAEGAGGWCVPLNRDQNMMDLAKFMGFSVLLVVRMRLGCLNHALLSAQSITASGLSMVGWVATVPEEMRCLEDNIQALREHLPAPCWGIIPSLNEPNPESASPYLTDIPAHWLAPASPCP